MNSENNTSPIKQICCCGDELFVLREAGTVEIYGNYHERHKTVSGWKDIAEICCNGHYVVGLQKDGTVVVFGDTYVPDWSNPFMSRFNSIELYDGNVVELNDDFFDKCNVTKWSDIKNVSVYKAEIYAVGKNGNIYSTDPFACIEGDYVQVLRLYDKFIVKHADGTLRMFCNMDKPIDCVFFGPIYKCSREILRSEMEDWKDIVTLDGNYIHIMGLKSDGTVKSTYRNSWSKERNALSWWENIVQIASGGEDLGVGLKSDGTVVLTEGGWRVKRYVKTWTDIVKICCDYSSVVGLKSDGTIVAAGGIVEYLPKDNPLFSPECFIEPEEEEYEFAIDDDYFDDDDDEIVEKIHISSDEELMEVFEKLNNNEISIKALELPDMLKILELYKSELDELIPDDEYMDMEDEEI